MSPLALLVWLPAAGGLLAGAFHRAPGRSRRIALVFTLATLAAAFWIAARFAPSGDAYAMTASRSWIAARGASFLVGVDGVSLPWILLTAALFPLTVLACGRSMNEGEGTGAGAFYAALLLFESFLLGVFTAVDVLSFYFFWEGSWIAAVLLSGGREEGRGRGALALAAYSAAGSVLLLGAVLYCARAYYVQTGSWSFDLRHWEGLVFFLETERWLFLGFAAALATRAAWFPFHSWLVRSEPDRPAPVNGVLTGAFLAGGVYGLLRFAIALFPQAARAYAPFLVWVAAAGALYAGAAALASSAKRPRRVLSYLSVLQWAIVLLATASLQIDAVKGAFLLSLAHGVFIAGLWFSLDGGARCARPLAAIFFTAAVVAPALALRTVPASGLAVLAGALGLGSAALAVFRAFRRLQWSRVRPIPSDLLILSPLLAALLGMALAPGTFVRAAEPPLRSILAPAATPPVLDE